MKKILSLLTIILSVFIFTNCEKNEDTIAITEINYVSFGETEITAGVDPGSTAVVEIPVYSSKSGSNRTYSVEIDEENSAAPAGSYSVPSTVTLDSNSNSGMLNVTLSDVDLGIGISTLVLRFVPESGEVYVGDPVTINYSQNCAEVTGTVDITFDAYPGETSWGIYDSLGGLVTFGLGYSGAPVSEPVVLCQGRSYTFVIFDAYGDGICCNYGAGSYSVTIGGVVVASGGQFGAQEATDFVTN